MRRSARSAVAAMALVAALGPTLPGKAAAPPSVARAIAEHVPGRVLVKTTSTRAAIRIASALRARRADVTGVPGWHRLRLPPGVPVARAAATARRAAGVLAVEADAVARLAAEPDDPCLVQACPLLHQWNLYETGMPLAWEAFPGRTHTAAERLAGSSPTIVAVLDTRVDATHPDWRNSGGLGPDATDGGQLDLSFAKSWVPESRHAGPAAYHGTYVAGILAAATGNGIDIAGAGYYSIVLPLTVVDGNGRAEASALAEAIVYARRQGARVVNLSLGMEAESQVVRDAIGAATAGPDGALVVAAAGNNLKDRPFYPGSWPEVMSVSGFDSARRLAPCSNYNANVSVSAPARHVPSLAPMPERQKIVDCGTSAAAPHVAGVASMLFAQDPTRSATEVRRIIESTAVDDDATPGRDHHFGHGRLDADAALRAGTGPTIDEIATTFASRSASEATVRATATSDAPITAAEAYVDRPGHAPARIALHPADGAWGGTRERLTGTIRVPPGSESHVHTLFVRAASGTEWGAAERGTLAIDRSAPEITNVRAENTVRGRRSTLSFTVRDAHATRFVVTVTIYAPDGSAVFKPAPIHVGAGPLGIGWIPSLTAIPGPHVAEIFVWDDAGNPASAAATFVVV